jgi:hypothetical protein
MPTQLPTDKPTKVPTTNYTTNSQTKHSDHSYGLLIPYQESNFISATANNKQQQARRPSQPHWSLGPNVVSQNMSPNHHINSKD